jgi:hypothetical protein
LSSIISEECHCAPDTMACSVTIPQIDQAAHLRTFAPALPCVLTGAADLE